VAEEWSAEDARAALEIVERWRAESDARYIIAEDRLHDIIQGRATDYGHPNKGGRIARDALYCVEAKREKGTDAQPDL
jgi:hypothetical protein